MAVTNFPAQFIPSIENIKSNKFDKKVYFDKVLCDVPCTGDGAIRKLPTKWLKWKTRDGFVLHPL